MCYDLKKSIEQARYPLGTQTFKEIIERNLRYVDKTEYVYKMHRLSKCVFLSRPRRFGKSLLASTIHSYFAGEEELFKGLKAHSLRKDWTPYPVLHFDMSTLKGLSSEDLNQRLIDQLEDYEEKFEVSVRHTSTGGILSELIRAVFEKTGRKVVLIIDEYDASLLSVIDNEGELMAQRQQMQQFYSAIKPSDLYLEFVFITGVTKFSQLSIFSELNSLVNISMLPEYAAVCGISKEELTTQFRPDVERLADKQGKTYEQILTELIKRYDGYHFSYDTKTDIFNPFSLINAFGSKELQSFWFGSGTPSILVKLSKKYPFNPCTVDGMEVEANAFDAAVTEMTSALPVLYQSGYLTIKDYDPDWQTFRLSYPNQEVRQGMMEGFAPSYLYDRDIESVSCPKANSR